jgi:hypothetical protein
VVQTEMEHINFLFRQGFDHRFAYDFETSEHALKERASLRSDDASLALILIFKFGNEKHLRKYRKAAKSWNPKMRQLTAVPRATFCSPGVFVGAGSTSDPPTHSLSFKIRGTLGTYQINGLVAVQYGYRGRPLLIRLSVAWKPNLCGPILLGKL